MKTPSLRRSAAHLTAVTVALIVLGSSPGCDSDSPTAPTLPEGEVTPTVLYTATSSRLVDPERRVVRTEAAYLELQDDIFGDGPAEEFPEVNFIQDMVLAVASGEQPEACNSIGITFASADGTDLSVTVTETGPATGCACAAVLTQPVQVVSVPRADEVFFTTVIATACPN